MKFSTLKLGGILLLIILGYFVYKKFAQVAEQSNEASGLGFDVS